MKTNKLVTLIAMLVLCINGALADGAKSLRLSEVAIGDSTTKGAWIEIQNTSWGTQNLGGFYITNDPSALDPNLSAPERIKKMRLIPTGNPATAITPQNCLLLYADGQENLGIQHLKFTLHPGDIVAIYSGNGVNLIDSVALPADIGPSQSFARDFDTRQQFCEEVEHEQNLRLQGKRSLWYRYVDIGNGSSLWMPYTALRLLYHLWQDSEYNQREHHDKYNAAKTYLVRKE